MAHDATPVRAQAELRCAHCGEPIHASEVDVEPGPGAKHATR
jgi:hypothetical protein